MILRFIENVSNIFLFYHLAAVFRFYLFMKWIGKRRGLKGTASAHLSDPPCKDGNA